jgi:hypothetical protein
VNLQADRNYWINPQANGERRIGHTYFSAWGGYFNPEPLKPFTVEVDTIDFQRDAWQPAFQWTRGEAEIHEPIELNEKQQIQVFLGNQVRNQTSVIQVPGQRVDAENPGTIRRTLNRGDWMSFSGQMGHGTLIPLVDNFAVNATVDREGGSYFEFGLAMGGQQLKPGDTIPYGFVIMRWPTGMPLSAGLDEKVVALLGLDGSAGFQPVMRQGSVEPDGFGLLGELKDGVFLADLPKADLSIRMPLRLTGVNPRWSAGAMRQGSTFFEPLAPDGDGVVWASFDTVHDAGRFFFGHPVVADRDDVIIQTLQRTDGGWTVVAHNPGDETVEVELTGAKEGPLADFAKSATLETGGEQRWVVNAQPNPWE